MSDDEIRDALAEDLCRVPTVWTGRFGPGELADALTPTVRRLIAAELREMAAKSRWAGDLMSTARDNFTLGQAEQARITARALHDRADEVTNPHLARAAAVSTTTEKGTPKP